MNKYLSTAIKASRKAEKIILNYFDRKYDVQNKKDGSPVTIADQKAEEMIIETISKVFPDHGFIGEETGEKKSEFQWIIDPIDGTKNFIRNLPYFGIEIALMKENEFILGVSNAPMLNEFMYAYKGEGAFLNDKPVQVSSKNSIQNSYISYGNIKYFIQKEYIKPLLSLSEDAHHHRGFGDFWSYHLLAQGKIDIMIEAGTKIWDVAACKVIIEEAGGKMTDINGNNLTKNSESTLASNGILHNDILEYLKSHN